jgi:calreticulin
MCCIATNVSRSVAPIAQVISLNSMLYAKLVACAIIALIAGASAKVYFKETFDKDWESRWVVSDWKKSDGQAGQWKLTASDWYGDAEKDKGIATSEDARFYAISAKMPSVFDNAGKDLVLQFSLKFPQKIDCGGGYIKLLPPGLNQKTFSGDSKYAVMFGPDVCGSSTRRTHVIFNYKGENLLTKKEAQCETDQLTHVYTLIVKPDNTYELRIDGKQKQTGSLFEDWNFLPPKEIPDPNAKKPADWVDDAKIADPSAKKPAGWDDIPAKVADPEAKKPDDWDDELDGEWEAPLIDNPEYKGEWSAPLIDNPAYKGPWVHPQVANPDYFEDDKVYQRGPMEYVGIEIWQVKAGTLYDNIIVTDSVAEAESFLKETYEVSKDKEKSMFDKAEEENRKKEEEERKKAAEDREKQEKELAADKDDDDEDDDDEDDKDEL